MSLSERELLGIMAASLYVCDTYDSSEEAIHDAKAILRQIDALLAQQQREESKAAFDTMSKAETGSTEGRAGEAAKVGVSPTRGPDCKSDSQASGGTCAIAEARPESPSAGIKPGPVSAPSPSPRAAEGEALPIWRLRADVALAAYQAHDEVKDIEQRAIRAVTLDLFKRACERLERGAVEYEARRAPAARAWPTVEEAHAANYKATIALKRGYMRASDEGIAAILALCASSRAPVVDVSWSTVEEAERELGKAVDSMMGPSDVQMQLKYLVQAVVRRAFRLRAQGVETETK